VKLQTNRQKINFYQPTQRKSCAATQFMFMKTCIFQSLGQAGHHSSRPCCNEAVPSTATRPNTLARCYLFLSSYIALGVFASCNSRHCSEHQGLWRIEYLNTGRAETEVCKQIGGRPCYYVWNESLVCKMTCENYLVWL